VESQFANKAFVTFHHER
jgi:hypothetical protein